MIPSLKPCFFVLRFMVLFVVKFFVCFVLYVLARTNLTMVCNASEDQKQV